MRSGLRDQLTKAALHRRSCPARGAGQPDRLSRSAHRGRGRDGDPPTRCAARCGRGSGRCPAKDGRQGIASMALLRHRQIGEQRQRLAPLRGDRQSVNSDVWRTEEAELDVGHDDTSWSRRLYTKRRQRNRLHVCATPLPRCCHACPVSCGQKGGSHEAHHRMGHDVFLFAAGCTAPPPPVQKAAPTSVPPTAIPATAVPPTAIPPTVAPAPTAQTDLIAQANAFVAAMNRRDVEAAIAMFTDDAETGRRTLGSARLRCARCSTTWMARW